MTTTINDQDKTGRAPLGQALQNARLNRSLSIEEAAAKLNLAVSTLQDIEDALADLIENKKYPSIFLRGYLVNYAKLVSLTELKQFPEYQQLSSSQTYSRNLRPSATISPAKKRGKKLLLSSVLLAVFCLVFFIVQTTFFSKSPAAISAVQENGDAVISGKITEESADPGVEAADLQPEEKMPVKRSESELVSQ